jgi:hypothetical protein
MSMVVFILNGRNKEKSPGSAVCGFDGLLVGGVEPIAAADDGCSR